MGSFVKLDVDAFTKTKLSHYWFIIFEDVRNLSNKYLHLHFLAFVETDI